MFVLTGAEGPTKEQRLEDLLASIFLHQHNLRNISRI